MLYEIQPARCVFPEAPTGLFSSLETVPFGFTSFFYIHEKFIAIPLSEIFPASSPLFILPEDHHF